MYDKDGTLLSFDFAKHSLVTGTSVDNFIKLGETTPAILSALRSFGGNLISYQDAGAPQKLVYRNWKQFGPRLGFAYQALDGKKAFVRARRLPHFVLSAKAAGLGRLAEQVRCR